jgi:hypothetical protein
VLVCDVPCELVTLLVMPFCCFAPAVVLADKIGPDGPRLTRSRHPCRTLPQHYRRSAQPTGPPRDNPPRADVIARVELRGFEPLTL